MAADPSTGTTAQQDETFLSAYLGPTLQLARASTAKPIFFGLMHLFMALMLGLPGGVLIMIVLTEKHSDSTLPMLGIGAAFLTLAVLYLLAAVRRFRLAGDRRLFVRAGPGGVWLSVPSKRGMAGFIRLQYPVKNFEMAWTEIERWFPFRRTVNGIPTQTCIHFDAKAGGRVVVDLGHFQGSQKALVDRIGAAIGRTDLRVG